MQAGTTPLQSSEVEGDEEQISFIILILIDLIILLCFKAKLVVVFLFLFLMERRGWTYKMFIEEN
tara:strand:+ start:960 stop:1154 length:195 start_codon:yes stop_codon:yes gene_type:complete